MKLKKWNRIIRKKLINQFKSLKKLKKNQRIIKKRVIQLKKSCKK